MTYRKVEEFRSRYEVWSRGRRLGVVTAVYSGRRVSYWMNDGPVPDSEHVYGYRTRSEAAKALAASA